MTIAIIQTPMSSVELSQLTKEFPSLELVFLPKSISSAKEQQVFEKAEIFFGLKLAKETLKHAKELRWIHCASSSLSRLCIKEIEETGNILLTNTINQNALPIAEFVLGGTLSFAKNLFHYKEADQFPALLSDCKWRQEMWTLKNKIFLQIGMGKTGSLITQKAAESGMRVFTIDEVKTFHPNTFKNFSYQELYSLLPEVDVVSVYLPLQKKTPFQLNAKALNLMKKDSILSIIGPPSLIEEKDLYESAALQGKFRGILLDISFETPLTSNSPLWDLPNIIITPDVSSRPKVDTGEAFRIFRYNLRQFMHENFSDMKNLIDPSIVDVDQSIYE